MGTPQARGARSLARRLSLGYALPSISAHLRPRSAGPKAPQARSSYRLESILDATDPTGGGLLLLRLLPRLALTAPLTARARRRWPCCGPQQLERRDRICTSPVRRTPADNARALRLLSGLRGLLPCPPTRPHRFAHSLAPALRSRFSSLAGEPASAAMSSSQAAPPPAPATPAPACAPSSERAALEYFDDERLVLSFDIGNTSSTCSLLSLPSGPSGPSGRPDPLSPRVNSIRHARPPLLGLSPALPHLIDPPHRPHLPLLEPDRHARPLAHPVPRRLRPPRPAARVRRRVPHSQRDCASARRGLDHRQGLEGPDEAAAAGRRRRTQSGARTARSRGRQEAPQEDPRAALVVVVALDDVDLAGAPRPAALSCAGRGLVGAVVGAHLAQVARLVRGPRRRRRLAPRTFSVYAQHRRLVRARERGHGRHRRRHGRAL